jgi:hypothetical protein
MNVTTVCLDIAKQFFQVHGVGLDDVVRSSFRVDLVALTGAK